MRIVEYQPQVTSIQYRLIRGTGLVAAVFSVVVCVLIIANFFTLKRSDPIHSAALITLTEQLKANPRDEALKEQIRELDYLARRAFFSSQHFNQVATYLLLGGLAVMIVAFKTMEAQQKRFPYPNSRDPKDDLIANAKWARKAVTVAGLLLVGFALSLAIPWKSPLNEVEAQARKAPVAKGPHEGTAAAHAAVATAVPGLPVPPREEMLKNWPAFRGASSGQTLSTHLPVVWNGEEGQGIAWKVELPKPGFNSPIIWNDKIFLSGADEQGREVFCYNEADGQLLWRYDVKDVPNSPAELPKVTSDTGLAASSMATDGTRVFALFANGDLVALDFEGKRIWNRNLGMPDNPYGHGSSLVVFEQTLLVQYDHQKAGALVGIDVHNGQTRWETARKFGPSWSTPLVVEEGGKAQVILAAEPTVVAYDPRSGQELWRLDCLKGGEVAPTPVYADGMLYVAADHVAISGVDVAKKAVAWSEKDLTPGVCSPLVVGELLFFGMSDGGIVCLNAKTGEEIWQEETDNGFYASPIRSGERIYLMDRAGVMHIFPAEKEFKSLGKPVLGEEAVASPAVLGNSIIYRGTKHLFRIGS